MRAFLLFLVVVFAASCGQRGPLYLRDSPPPGMKPPKPEPYKPVPYPKDAARDASEDEERGKK
jgi:predicted small lipoprotein YifL